MFASGTYEVENFTKVPLLLQFSSSDLQGGREFPQNNGMSVSIDSLRSMLGFMHLVSFFDCWFSNDRIDMNFNKIARRE